jgi:hypothetical protein
VNRNLSLQNCLVLQYYYLFWYTLFNRIHLVDFPTLRDAYLANIDFEKIKETKEEPQLNIIIRDHRIEKIEKAIKNEDEFHKYICKSYYDLVKEPKEELLSTFIQASQDFRTIDETLRKIDTQLNEITKRNNINEIQEKKPILHYYKEQNEKAREEILNFLKNDIKEYALNTCFDNSFLSGLLGRVQYIYRWNPDSFKPRYPNDLENKFGNLPVPEFMDLSNLYKEDKPAFNVYLSEFIVNQSIVFSIRNLIYKHHLLAVRDEIILESLNTFEHGAKIMFANAVPTIIEGILHDLCLLNGEDENEILTKGFQHKLDRLQKLLSYDLNYEYYSFRFRLFRNKVAHGRLTKQDVNELADLLLLDLYDICKLVFSMKLKLNQKRFVIDELNKDISKPEYKYVIEYILLEKTEVPLFYGLGNKIAEVEKLIVSSEFWNFMEKELNSGGEPVLHGIVSILKILRNRKPFDKRVTKLFKKAGVKDVDKELANHYIKYLTKDYW